MANPVPFSWPPDAVYDPTNPEHRRYDDVPTRRVEVTAYEGHRHGIRGLVARFDVPETFSTADVDDYLTRSFNYLGLFEVFDQAEFLVGETHDRYAEFYEIPDPGYEWKELS